MSVRPRTDRCGHETLLVNAGVVRRRARALLDVLDVDAGELEADAGDESVPDAAAIAEWVARVRHYAGELEEVVNGGSALLVGNAPVEDSEIAELEEVARR